MGRLKFNRPKKDRNEIKLDLLDRVPTVLDVVRHFLCRSTTDIEHHLAPEGTCADRSGHQIRTVKTEGGCVLQDFTLFAQDTTGVSIQVYSLVWDKKPLPEIQIS